MGARRSIYTLLLLLAAVVAAQEPSPPPAALSEDAAPDDAPDGSAEGVADVDDEEEVVEAVEAEEEPEAAPSPPPAARKASSAGKSGNPVRSAVLAGRGALGMVTKPISGLPTVVMIPAVLLLGGVGFLKGRGGGAASAAVAAALSEPVETPAGVEEDASAAVSNELWLDRQIDKLIALIKVLIGR